MARSGRQLAAAARAAGVLSLVVDLFGDSDTRELAERCLTLSADPSLHFEPADLLAAVAGLTREYGPMPLVWGSGFEAQPDLLQALNAHCPVLGCDLRRLPGILDPARFAHALRELAITHPSTLAAGRECPPDAWLVKRRGAAGGAHVQHATPARTLAVDEYLQQFVPGRSLSVAFVATRRGAVILGMAEHLRLQPNAGAPFRYGGAVGGPRVPVALISWAQQTLNRLCTRFGLAGLGGVDLVLTHEDCPVLLELNPRPTATFDLLCDPGMAFRAHLAACTGGDSTRCQSSFGSRAHAILHADDPIQIPKAIDWPDWVTDRPAAGAVLADGAPVCSVHATGPDAATAQRVLQRRFDELTTALSAQSRRIRSRPTTITHKIQ